MKPIADYVEVLKGRVEDRGREGSPAAAIYERVACELEELVQRFAAEQLSLSEAAEESGYAPDALRRLRKAGKWSGTRADLPRRPRQVAAPRPSLHVGRTSGAGRPSLVDDILRRQAEAPGSSRRTRRSQ